MKTIVCDMDSIVSDFYQGLLDAYEKDSGQTPDRDSIDAWDYTFPNGKSAFDYFKVPGFFRNLRPVPGALDTLEGLHNRGNEIVLASSATLTNAPGEKWEWLTQHMPWLPRRRVFFCAEKFRVRGDIFIDDYPENAREYRAHNPDALIMGIRYPYNASRDRDFDFLVSGHENLYRAWSQLERILDDYT